MDEPNPWAPPHKEVKVNLIGVWSRIRGRGRERLRASLKASRERYRRALHHKDPEITETELYDELAEPEKKPT